MHPLEEALSNELIRFRAHVALKDGVTVEKSQVIWIARRRVRIQQRPVWWFCGRSALSCQLTEDSVEHVCEKDDTYSISSFPKELVEAAQICRTSPLEHPYLDSLRERPTLPMTSSPQGVGREIVALCKVTDRRTA